MMRGLNRVSRRACVLAVVAFAASGCGGGDAAVDPAADPTPAPGDSTTGQTVGGEGEAPVDPATGAPVEPQLDPETGLPVPAAPAAPTATVPVLDGSDTSGSNQTYVAGDGAELFIPQVKWENKPIDVEDGKVPGLPSSKPEPTKPAAPSKPAIKYSGARVYVNGMTYSVERGGAFPKGNPMFRLTTVSQGSIEIQLVAGEFTSSGGDGTVLDKGQLVTMVNSSEQVTYKLKFIEAIVTTSDIAM